MQVLSKQDSHSSHRFFKDTWHCLSSSSNLSFTSSISRKASWIRKKILLIAVFRLILWMLIPELIAHFCYLILHYWGRMFSQLQSHNGGTENWKAFPYGVFLMLFSQQHSAAYITKQISTAYLDCWGCEKTMRLSVQKAFKLSQGQESTQVFYLHTEYSSVPQTVFSVTLLCSARACDTSQS